MTVGLVLGWSAHARNWVWRAAGTSAVVVAYLSYSRGVAVGVGVGIAVVIALSRYRWLAAFNTMIAGIGAVAVILIIRSQPEIAEGTGQSGAGAVALRSQAPARSPSRAARSRGERVCTGIACRRVLRALASG